MAGDLAPGAAERGERPSRTGQVYEQIIGLLIGGELQPGDVIVERRIAERLDASRTPIREALGRLAAEGLVLKQPSRGVTVSLFSTAAFVELLDVRQLLEAEAARLAAGRIPAPRIRAIRAALAALAAWRAPTLAEIREADDLLHGEIADAAGNVLMAALIRDLGQRTHVFSAYRDPDRASFSLEGDTALLDAVESGDGERAREAMAQRIGDVKTAVIERLAGVAR